MAVLASGFRRTKITESPRKNIFEMNRSLFTGLTFFFPLPVRGISVHISLTLRVNWTEICDKCKHWFAAMRISNNKKKQRMAIQFTFLKPCCNDDRMLLHGPTASYCCGNWLILVYCFLPIVLVRRVVQCWTLPLLGAPTLRELIPILVCSKPCNEKSMVNYISWFLFLQNNIMKNVERRIFFYLHLDYVISTVWWIVHFFCVCLLNLRLRSKVYDLKTTFEIASCLLTNKKTCQKRIQTKAPPGDGYWWLIVFSVVCTNCFFINFDPNQFACSR